MQLRSNDYATCTPLGKQCPKTYPMPLNPNWSDSEGEEEDWDGNIQKEKDQKEKEQEEHKLKVNNYFPPNLKYMPNTLSDTDDTLTPECTDTLVPTSEERQKEKQREKEDAKGNSEIDSKTDYSLVDTIDNIMLKKELCLHSIDTKKGIVYSSFITVVNVIPLSTFYRFKA